MAVSVVVGKGGRAHPRAATQRDPLRLALPLRQPLNDDTTGYEEGGGSRQRESKVDYIISPPPPGAHPPFCEC